MLKYDSPIELPKKLGRNAFIVLWVLQCAAQQGTGPVEALWIKDRCPEFGINTVTDALRVLTSPEVQLAVRTTGGWQLNKDGAFQLPLGYGLPAQQAISQNHSESDFENTGTKIIDILPEKASKKVQNHSESDFGQSLESLESINLKPNDLGIKNLDSLDSFDGIAKKTTPELLCKEAYRILGKSVRCDDVIKTRSVGEILGWMADGHQNRDSFMSPYGYVYRGLRRELKHRGKPAPERRPDMEYLRDPFAFLPFDYLSAVGLEEYFVQRCENCKERDGLHTPGCIKGFTKWVESEQVIQDTSEQPDYLPEDSTEFDTIIFAQTVPNGIPASELWGMVKADLQKEMARASFDTWASETFPIGWDDESGLLSISAKNQYAVDWLTNRLIEQVELMLANLLGRTVKVGFIAAGGRSE